MATSSRFLLLFLKPFLYHFFFFFFSNFSVPRLLSESAESLLEEPLAGDKNFLYHFGFLPIDAVGLELGLFRDSVLRRWLPAVSIPFSTESVHIDDDMFPFWERSLGEVLSVFFIRFSVVDEADLEGLLLVEIASRDLDFSFRFREADCGSSES